MLYSLAIALGLTPAAAVAPLSQSWIQVVGSDEVVPTQWSAPPTLDPAEMAKARKLGDRFAIVYCRSVGADGRLTGCMAGKWRGSNPSADRLALTAIDRARVAPAMAATFTGKELWVSTTVRLLGGDGYPKGACPPTWCHVEPGLPAPPQG